MALFVDDYAIFDTAYLIHAFPVNPDDDAPPGTPYLLCVATHLGQHASECTVQYPTRALRDAAFEDLVALVRKELRERQEELEDDDD